MTTRQWKGHWVNCNKIPGASYNGVAQARYSSHAPYLRGVFNLASVPKKATAYVCAPGWHEVYVNGHKVDDRVLAPTVTEFDHHVSYLEYDIAHLLRPGKNAIVLLLGSGWFNCTTREVWQFYNAPWRNDPMAMVDVVCDGATVAYSNEEWKCQNGPITMNSLRNGEDYDYNQEIPGFSEPDFDDSSWYSAQDCNPPGGIVMKEEIEPCRTFERFCPQRIEKVGDSIVYDFGVNMAGFGEITFESDAPVAEDALPVKIQYGERLYDNPDEVDPEPLMEGEPGDWKPDFPHPPFVFPEKFGHLSRKTITVCLQKGEFQTENITLPKTGGAFKVTHRIRFSYHGFQYAEVMNLPAGVRISKFEAVVVHTDFRQVGKFSCDDRVINRLQEMTMRSYLSNFVGIPTDCPHREKNGWTGDAQLAMQTGLWNYDGLRAYKHFIRIFADCQRANGQFPGIAPSGGWGYTWGAGPAWDSVIFEVAWELHVYYGDDEVIHEHYDAMRKYLDYCKNWNRDGLMPFGLGDWCPYDRMPDIAVSSTAFIYSDCVRFAEFARMLGKEDDAKEAEAMAAELKAGYNKAYNHGNGHYGKDEQMTLACTLYHHLCTDEDYPLVLQNLVDAVRKNNHKSDWGILTAKWLPRVLADNGYADDVMKVFTQSETPSCWGYWEKIGATTLWEDWAGLNSCNHIMFGDISAWFYEYLGGIKPSVVNPGFAEFTIAPKFVKCLNHVRVEYESVKGKIEVEWERQKDGTIALKGEVPQGTVADIVLPDGVKCAISGHFQYNA